MSTGLIIVIVAVIVIIGLLLMALPRMRARREERELENRRQQAVETHRGEAQLKETRAEHAERIAQKERAEAQLHESRAQLHEQGLADDDLERDLPGDGTATDSRFARGTDTRDVDGDGHVADDAAAGRTRRL
jgi:FtsZ-interacting cell division protein ZipA